MVELVLSDEEREELLRWAADAGAPARAVRAEIVLRCARPGAVNERVAGELGVTAVTVGKWRARFAEGRLAGLNDGERPGRPRSDVKLTAGEHDQLMLWAAGSGPGVLVLRSKIVLACAGGESNEDIAIRLATHPDTVSKWRTRFVRDRLDGLAGTRRRGRPSRITSEQIERVVTATTRDTPVDAPRWTRAAMARHTGLSKSTIGRIWRNFDLKPHLTDSSEM